MQNAFMLDSASPRLTNSVFSDIEYGFRKGKLERNNGTNKTKTKNSTKWWLRSWFDLHQMSSTIQMLYSVYLQRIFVMSWLAGCATAEDMCEHCTSMSARFICVCFWLCIILLRHYMLAHMLSLYTAVWFESLDMSMVFVCVLCNREMLCRPFFSYYLRSTTATAAQNRALFSSTSNSARTFLRCIVAWSTCTNSVSALLPDQKK